MTGEAGRCLDCGAALHGRFCHACGQDAERTNHSASVLLKLALQDTFGVDGKLPRTLRPLFARPGFLAGEWSAGRRERYVTPFRLYLVSAVVLVTLRAIGQDGEGLLNGVVRGFAEDSLNADRWEGFSGQLNAMLDTLVLFLAPLCAALLRLFFLRSRRWFSEYLVFALHFHAAFFFCQALLYLLPLRLERAGSSALLVGAVLYMAVGAHRFFGTGWVSSVVRSAGFLLLYGFIVLIVLLLTGAAWVELLSGGAGAG